MTALPTADPLLMETRLGDGAHVNLVGSGERSFAEVDSDFIVRSRLFADRREGVLQQGREYLRALGRQD